MIRNVEVDGRPGLDVRLAAGRIVEIGQRLERGGEALDGGGGALIPGLHDHHIHLLSSAAEVSSVRLSGVGDRGELEAALAAAAAARPPGAWIRAVGWHEHRAGDLTAADLDAIAPHHKMRVQHQTGALWVLNSQGLAEALGGEPAPPWVETDPRGRPTGRLWRGDAWLGDRIREHPPPLASIGAKLAACGVTGLTDATAVKDASAPQLLADAARAGELPQRLLLMNACALAEPADGAFAVGPVKIMLDERDLPDLDQLGAIIGRARAWGRNVAAHCVTGAELALMLAALDQFGARPGDRIEHGGVIPEGAIAPIVERGLTVVTQPSFVFERGDRYLAETAPGEHDDLYRCASLLAAGVAVAASSDAPYGDLDPWAAIRAAVRRRTREGRPIGLGEALGPSAALALFLGSAAMPGGPTRRIAVGAPADLCLLKAPLRDVLEAPDAEFVAATLVAGKAVYAAI